ncbi:hypothetical protein BBK36DRAFT_1140129 [Trichoderma citrinoviride]|uniref:Uncharacterized protein n=1 Tax=Trichoderma citrinoviride TaxID=58853 RepID=A0A2T4BDY0_9HYPO|nr:hypothetical protein BBK36DRAFT_1140129 [Trichoderma citrinoviride]PTB67478.1 hypothetical protein BBK36DRAFT_1140129 [Trichoderma citrinoviride]
MNPAHLKGDECRQEAQASVVYQAVQGRRLLDFNRYFTLPGVKITVSIFSPPEWQQLIKLIREPIPSPIDDDSMTCMYRYSIFDRNNSEQQEPQKGASQALLLWGQPSKTQFLLVAAGNGLARVDDDAVTSYIRLLDNETDFSPHSLYFRSLQSNIIPTSGVIVAVS